MFQRVYLTSDDEGGTLVVCGLDYKAAVLDHAGGRGEAIVRQRAL